MVKEEDVGNSLDYDYRSRVIFGYKSPATSVRRLDSSK